MKSKFLAFSFFSLLSVSTFATVDSYVTIKLPVTGLYSAGICLIDTLAWDGITSIGTKESLTTFALNNPYRIPGIQAGQDPDGFVQVNVLYGSGVRTDIDVDMNSFNKATITIDATEASQKAKSLEERAQVIKTMKIALYTSMANTLSDIIPTANAKLIGLPNQQGISNPLPTSFKSSFTRKSPYMELLKKELEIVDGIKNCL